MDIRYSAEGGGKMIINVDGMDFMIREDTNDNEIVESVVGNNEYRLPNIFSADNIVLDIGAHIGAFTLACLRRGAERIYAFEPEGDNFKLLQTNTGDYSSSVTLVNAAVIGYPHTHREIWCAPWEDEKSDMAAIKIGISGYEKVRTILFDSILDWIQVVHGKGVDLAKLDCEGSEWSILFTSKYLRYVRRIIGEFHEMSSEDHLKMFGILLESEVDCSRSYLLEFLKQQGFETEIKKGSVDALWSSVSGIFMARKG